MTFRPSAVPEFMAIFEEVKSKIRGVEGCQHIELLQLSAQPHVLFTLSCWRDEAALEVYRQSLLFVQTWKKTKALFSEKPEAWSLERIDPPVSADEQQR